MSDTPSVIIKSKFIAPKKSKGKSASTDYNNFLNYMDRDNTKKDINGYSNYQEYMERNNEKSSGLFSNNKDHLTEKEKEEYKDIFKRSQEKGSLLWQDVISFNNEWLKEIGVLKDNEVDEKQLKNVTRSSVNLMLENENMTDNSVWSGAIHYNTDNIHIHLATVQTHNFRERGKRKPQTIEKMKSNVANKLMNRTKENEKINIFIREKLVKTKREDSIPTLKNKLTNKDMVNQFNSIYKSLPNDKRKWKYNMNAMKEIRPEIDKLTDIYIEKNFKNEYKEFSNQIDENVQSFKKTYGNNSKADDYKKNVYEDMYSRMGNTILTEMREYDNNKKSKHKNKKINQNKLYNKYKTQQQLKNSVYQIDRYMKDDLQSMKNQNEHRQLEREQEMER